MFLQQYANNFDANNFAKSISLEEFEKYKQEFEYISSNSSLRKIFDTYLDIFKKYNGKGEDFEVEKEIWFAKIAYQEKRKVSGKPILPNGFNKFLREIYSKLNDSKKFKQFLEVFVAYHKFFTGAK